MVIYLAGLQSIPADLYEAAAIDSSDGISKHWDITVPLMKPYYLVLVAVISPSLLREFSKRSHHDSRTTQ